MESPTTEPPVASTAYTRADVDWETTRKRTADAASATKTLHNELDLPHVRLVEKGTFEATVKRDDPGGWTSNNRMRLTMEYEDETVEIITSNRLSETVLRLDTAILLNGYEIFEESWTKFRDTSL
jgi:hypothetical protein